MIRSDRVFRFSDDPPTLWAAITRCDEYRTWWPWLRSFDGDGFREGSVWHCEVKPPTPWSLRFTVTLDDVAVGTSVFAHVDGDIVGTASVHLEAAATGSSIHLLSDLAPKSSVLRAVSVAARPLAVWGHDWVLDQGVAQLRRRALPPRER